MPGLRSEALRRAGILRVGLRRADPYRADILRVGFRRVDFVREDRHRAEGLSGLDRLPAAPDKEALTDRHVRLSSVQDGFDPHNGRADRELCTTSIWRRS